RCTTTSDFTTARGSTSGPSRPTASSCMYGPTRLATCCNGRRSVRRTLSLTVRSCSEVSSIQRSSQPEAGADSLKRRTRLSKQPRHRRSPAPFGAASDGTPAIRRSVAKTRFAGSRRALRKHQTIEAMDAGGELGPPRQPAVQFFHKEPVASHSHQPGRLILVEFDVCAVTGGDVAAKTGHHVGNKRALIAGLAAWIGPVALGP